MKRPLSLVVASTAIILLGQGCWGAADVKPEPTPTPSESTNTQPMTYSFPGVLPEAETNVKVRMKTTKGDIVLQIQPDQGANAASNFVYLVKQKYYDGITFHRREPGFVIQGGDPKGNGTGGPGYQFADDPVKPVGQNDLLKPLPDEIKQALIAQGAPPNHPLLVKGALYGKGVLAMANAGPNTNGSQFFIMLEDAPLTTDYSIFGHVIEGQDVVDRIEVGDKMTEVTVE
jgi:peptidyl-prolyl cis-trans isomerase B (cyclophilin B)